MWWQMVLITGICWIDQDVSHRSVYMSKPEYQEQHLQKYQLLNLDYTKYKFIGYSCSIIKNWKERYFKNKRRVHSYCTKYGHIRQGLQQKGIEE